jgi:hypothetical protein
MAIVDKKKEIFGKIAAARTLTDNMPSRKSTSSFSSINNNGNSVSFLTDLIQSLVGYEALVEIIVDTLTISMSEIENSVKKALKKELKNLINCDIDPSIPSWFRSTGDGVIIELRKIDFIDILRTPPSSIEGSLLYKDITPNLIDSTDFNTFLYGLIQDDGVTHTWNGILDFTFNSVGDDLTPNNTLLIKTNPLYDDKTLTDLNNNYIDSISLFDTSSILTQVMDIIYGSISSSVGKSLKQLENEALINKTLDKFINNTNATNLQDSAFTFSKEEIYSGQLEALDRKKGVKKIKIPSESNAGQNSQTLNQSLNEISASVPLASLTSFNDNVNNSTDLLTKKNSVISGLNQMSFDTIKNVKNPVDNTTVKFDFVNEIIKNLGKAIINKILLPNVIILYLINYKIVYGETEQYENSIDFLKKNKNLINRIIKTIGTEIITILLRVSLKHIERLVAAKIAKKVIEKNTLNLSQILSLTGAPKARLKSITDNL